MVGHWRTEKARKGRKRKETPIRLKNVGKHFPVKGVERDHTCQVCREKHSRFMANSPDVPKAQVPLQLTKTTVKCAVCDVYICISKENNCFQTWHTQTEYWHMAACVVEDEGQQLTTSTCTVCLTSFLEHFLLLQ